MTRDLYDFFNSVFEVESALLVIVAKVAHLCEPVLSEELPVGCRVVEVALQDIILSSSIILIILITFMQVIVLTQISPSSPGPSLSPVAWSLTKAALPGVRAPRQPEVTSNVQDTLPVCQEGRVLLGI